MVDWLWLQMLERCDRALQPGFAGSSPRREAWRAPVTNTCQGAELTLLLDMAGHRKKFEMEVQHLSLEISSFLLIFLHKYTSHLQTGKCPKIFDAFLTG